MTRFIGWFASIVLHLAAIFWITSPLPRAPDLRAPIEVEVVSERQPSRLVSTEDSGNRTVPKKTDVYSSHNPSVHKPSRRAATGLTLADLGIANRQLLGLGDGPLEGQNALSAATDESLAEIDIGQRTLLNAKEYAHWLYFQRIKSLLGPVWRLDIDGKMGKMQAVGKKFAKAESITQVAVVLDAKGNVKKVSLTQGSGSQELDASAIEAFHAAGPFPNPPLALHRKDGTVWIRWSFIINQKPTRVTYSQETAGGTPARNMP